MCNGIKFFHAQYARIWKIPVRELEMQEWVREMLDNSGKFQEITGKIPGTGGKLAGNYSVALKLDFM